MADIETPSVARWSERFVAFLIDVIIISVIGTVIGAAALSDGGINMVGDEIPQLEDDIFLTVFLPGLVSMAYLTGMEYITGTTVGRRVLSLRVMGIDGEKPTIYGLLLSNAGKSFLLVIDVILGMVFAKGNRQRIFAKWGGVVVVKAHKTEHPPKFRLD